MTKINKLAISILMSYFLLNSLTEKDFKNLKEILTNKINEISPNITNFLIELNNLVSQESTYIENKTNNDLILKKINDVEQELKKTKIDDLTDLIINKINKGKINE